MLLFLSVVLVLYNDPNVAVLASVSFLFVVYASKSLAKRALVMTNKNAKGKTKTPFVVWYYCSKKSDQTFYILLL